MTVRNFHHFLKNEITELYISSAIRTLALAMVGIFVPVYLIQQGYSFTQTVLFFFVMNLMHALFVIPAAYFSSRFGVKHTIMISLPLMFAYFVMLYNLDKVPFYLVPATYGISKAFYWFGYHLDFSKFCDADKKGKEIGQAKIITSIVHVIGPTMGGLILAWFGFNTLFVVIAVLVVAIAIPLAYTKDNKDSFEFSLKKIFKHPVSEYGALAGFGFDDGMRLFIWPIFIFTMLGSYTKLGIVSSLTLFCSLITVYVAAKYTDKNIGRTMTIGSNLRSLGWIVRSFVYNPFTLYIAEAFYGITHTITGIAFDAKSYEKANTSNRINYMIFREISINFFSSALCLFVALTMNMKLGIFIAAIGSLVMMLY